MLKTDGRVIRQLEMLMHLKARKKTFFSHFMLDKRKKKNCKKMSFQLKPSDQFYRLLQLLAWVYLFNLILILCFAKDTIKTTESYEKSTVINHQFFYFVFLLLYFFYFIFFLWSHYHYPYREYVPRIWNSTQKK